MCRLEHLLVPSLNTQHQGPAYGSTLVISDANQKLQILKRKKVAMKLALLEWHCAIAAHEHKKDIDRLYVRWQ